MNVVKRDGSLQVFDFTKVVNAATKAFESVNQQITDKFVEKLQSAVDKIVHNKDGTEKEGSIDVEDIQDLIQNELIKGNKYEVVESFIRYRQKREEYREKHLKLVKDIKKALSANDVQNQNANLDEESFGGRIGSAADVVAKNDALKNVMSSMARRNHENNMIYQHDLNAYSIGQHNCVKGNSWIKINQNGKIRTLQIKTLADELHLNVNSLIDLTKQSFLILSRNGWTKLKNISCRETTDEEYIYTFNTRSGFPLKVTENHLLPIIRDNVEIVAKAKDIKIGDCLLDAASTQLSSKEIDESFLNLTLLNDDDVDIRITNLSPLKNYLRYRYGKNYVSIFKSHKKWELTPKALSIKLKDFKELIDEYPIPFEVVAQLRIRNCGSKHTYPLQIPFSESLAKIYGYIYADGGVYWNKEKQLSQLTFTNTNEDIMNSFIEAYEEVFGYKLNKSYPTDKQLTNNVIRVTDGSKLIVKLFKNFAGAKKYSSEDISIPDFIINGNENIKYAFISAAIDTDGCLNNDSITYSSCSPTYCEQLKIILQSLGYHPSINFYARKGSKYKFGSKVGYRKYDAYNVNIRRADEKYELYKHLSTIKQNDSYVYKGLNNKINESKIISIKKEIEPNCVVYDVETGDHWFIVNNYVSHNCLSIPFDTLLANGFITRQTDVRPANSINTAFQLLAVIFQIQSLQQFGGVAATHLDWTMVPYVRKSFFKHYNDVRNTLSLKPVIYDKDKIKDLSIEDKFYKGCWCDFLKHYVYKKALERTKRELYQAVEGMFHNLNTLQSRSGNQLPFSSINYGTCTLTEGRLVTNAILDVSIEGLGKYHITSIFPCGIFQYKKGVNDAPGTPNYDLFRKALKSTAQRIYPNYANLDFSSQKSWVKQDREAKQEYLNSLSEEDKTKLITVLEAHPEIADKMGLYIEED